MEKPPEYIMFPEQNKIKKEPVSKDLPEREKIANARAERPAAKQDINKLAENKSKDDRDPDGFANFISDKFKNKITRRNFLKITGTAIGLGLGYKYFENDIDSLWDEYQKEKLSKAIKESKDLQTSTELLGKIAEYPEMIEKSKKQTLNEFAGDISKKDFDNLILGEWHGIGPTTEKAAYLLEELIKNNKKISAICLEGLTYTDPEQVEATKKFNKGELSTDEMAKFTIFREPLLELARKYSIEIMGIEKEKTDLAMNDWYGRFREISERIGEISKEKSKDGIVVTYIGQGHVTIDSWENENLWRELSGRKDYYPSKEEALGNNYTINEYLEKINMKPIAIQIEEWQKLANNIDESLVNRADLLSSKDKKIFYEIVKNKWQSYRLKEKEDFVVPYPKAKENTYSMIIPSEVPDKPPKLSEKMGSN